MTRRRITTPAVVALAAASVALAAILALVVDVASAQSAPAVSASARSASVAVGSVSVTSDRGTHATFTDLSPGVSERWRVSATVTSSADLDLRIARSGALARRADGLALAVRSCPEAWSAAGSCAAASTTVVPVTALAASRFDSPLPLGRFAAGRASHLLLTFSLPDSPAARTDESLMGKSASVVITVGATGGVQAGSGGGSGGGSGANGGVRPGGGGAGGGSGSGAGGGGAGSGSGAGGVTDGSGSGVASGDRGHSRPAGSHGDLTFGLGRLADGALAWTGTWVAWPAGVGLGLVAGGLFVLLGQWRSSRTTRRSGAGRGRS